MPGGEHRAIAFLICVTAASASAAGCVHLSRRDFASVRTAEYFAAHRELPPSIARAIEQGHVIAGMDFEQVQVVLGDPVRKVRPASNPGTDVWIYPGYRLHQGGHGAWLFRIIFVDGRVVLVEPV